VIHTSTALIKAKESESRRKVIHSNSTAINIKINQGFRKMVYWFINNAFNIKLHKMGGEKV